MYNFSFKKSYEDVYKAHQDITRLFNTKDVRFAVDGDTVIVRQETLPLVEVTGKVSKLNLTHEVGKRMMFRVRCYVAKRNSKTQDYEPITDTIAQSSWFHAKAENGGFKVKNMSVISEGPVMVNRPPRPFPLNSVVFEGELEVTDTDKFTIALKRGIGKKGTFGFGLMTVDE